jgi:hypothetical protein
MKKRDFFVIAVIGTDVACVGVTFAQADEEIGLAANVANSNNR